MVGLGTMRYGSLMSGAVGRSAVGPGSALRGLLVSGRFWYGEPKLQNS